MATTAVHLSKNKTTCAQAVEPAPFECDAMSWFVHEPVFMRVMNWGSLFGIIFIPFNVSLVNLVPKEVL